MTDRRTDSRKVFLKPQMSKRDEQRQMTHLRLLENALMVFASKTYASATVDEIARAAGVSRAAFYLHFNSKLDLMTDLRAHLRPVVAAYYERLDEALASGEREAVDAWLAEAIEWLRHHKNYLVAVDEAFTIEHDKLSGPAMGSASFMPRYLASWPPEQQLEARLRVWLAVQTLTRVFVRWEVDGQMQEVSQELMLKVLRQAWSAALDVEASSPAKLQRPVGPKVPKQRSA